MWILSEIAYRNLGVEFDWYFEKVCFLKIFLKLCEQKENEV